MRWRSWLGPIVLAILASSCGTPRDHAAGAALASATVAPVAPVATVGSAWPELPRTAAAADALILARTTRPAAAVDPGSAASEGVMESLAREPAALVAGEPGIVARLQRFFDKASAEGRDAVLLFGTFHDNGGQIDEFRRLIGPLGLRGLTHVAVEHLAADGAWKGVPAEAQRGDDAEIGAYLASGGRGALDLLAQRHATADYAAWKFGYQPSILDLFITARAAGIRLAGCDLPAATRALLADVPERSLLRLRELHCLSSLPPAPGPRRIALLWGQAHLRQDALQRFLPPSTAVMSVYAIGHRSGEWTTEGALSAQLALTDPLLVPFEDDGSSVVVLYPGGALAADVDRARDEASSGESGLHVAVHPGAGTLRIGERSFPVGASMKPIDCPPGDHAYVLTIPRSSSLGPTRFAGAIHLPPGGGLDLSFSAEHRRLTLIERPAAR